MGTVYFFGTAKKEEKLLYGHIVLQKELNHKTYVIHKRLPKTLLKKT